MVNTTLEIQVVKFRIRLVRVAFTGGYQLVCGGRLVLEVRDGVKTPHPDLPAYRPEDFPVSFMRWSDGEEGGVTVEAISRKSRPVSSVRACTLLFAACNQDAVRTFIKGDGK